MAGDLTTRLAAIYADEMGRREKMSELEANVSRLSMAGSQEEQAWYRAQEAQGDTTDYSAHPLVAGQQRRHVSVENLAETMYSEFGARYGYKPTDETAKVIAASFRGRDLTREDVRADFYDRIAAYDGREAQEQPEPAYIPQGNLAARVSDAGRPQGDDNEAWTRSTTEWQAAQGYK